MKKYFKPKKDGIMKVFPKENEFFINAEKRRGSKLFENLPKIGFTWYEKLGLIFCKMRTDIDMETPVPIRTIYKTMFGRMYILKQNIAFPNPRTFPIKKSEIIVQTRIYQPLSIGVISAGFNYMVTHATKPNYFLINKASDLIGMSCDEIIKLGDWNQIPEHDLDEIFDIIQKLKIPVK